MGHRRAKGSLLPYERLRRRLNRSRAKHAYVVAGLGRCGTTLAFDSLVERGFRGRRAFLRRFEDIASYRNGSVYKTHSLPPKELPGNVKVVFLFGDALNTVISTHRMINEWGALHYAHFGAPGYRTNDDLFHRDCLDLLGHFDQWYRPQSFPFLSVRYETLYSVATRAALSRFLGFDLRLPPYQERQTNGRAHPMRDRILEAYEELDRRIRDAEDVCFWPGRAAQG